MLQGGDNPFAAQELRAPRFTAARATVVAREHWGLVGGVSALDSHQDQNFRIDAAEGRFVLKVANAAFTTPQLEMQNRAMEHVAAALPGAAPRPVQALDGRDHVRVGGHDVRLVTYLEGEPLRRFGYLAPPVLREAGRLVGQITGVLSSFDDPAADRVSQWDVQHAARVTAAFASAVRDRRRRDLVERTMEQARGALDALGPRLRRQLVHGDPTDWNLLAVVDAAGRPTPRSLIDFGDMVRSWVAAECAVLATAVCGRGRRALQDAAEVVRGFHAAMPLSEEEVAALPALMAARAVVSTLGGEQQHALEPANPYVAKGVEISWSILSEVSAFPPRLVEAAFREACGLRRPRPPRVPLRSETSPLVKGLERRRAVLLDLSPKTNRLRPGAWRNATEVRKAVAAAQAEAVVPIGRYGERRIVHDAGPEMDEPSTAHLGADLFLPAGTPVFAPLPSRVARVAGRELTLEAEGISLWLSGLEPRALPERLAAGDRLGAVATPGAGERLPAHLHVQVGPPGLEELPGLVPASLAGPWSALCPDPGPLLGFEVAALEEPPGASLERRRRFVASPQRLYYPTGPPQVERAWRQWLYDVHGRSYLDVINNVAILGHSHPRVEEAAARQLRLLNTNSRFLYDAMGRFAERLAALVPDPLGVVFFVNSGSEANDLALRLVRAVTGRKDVLSFEGCYHGWTSATNETLTAPPGVHPIERPHPDPDRSLGQLRRTVERLVADGSPPAALLCEPVLGNLGGVVPPAGYLRSAYEAVRAAGGLCIADEVQVGYGRLGRNFWAFEQQGVVPDVVTIAKATGNGHPVAAVITTREIADTFGRDEDLFSSVGGSPVSCEVGLAVLDALEGEQLQSNARAVGDHLTTRLRPLVAEFPIVRALHGVGLYRGLELGHEGGQPATEAARAICERMLGLGVVVQPTGPGGNVLKLKPPLCVTAADVDFLAGALRTTLSTGW